jgi:hypothetical protein
MRPDMRGIAAHVHEAVLVPRLWPCALEFMTASLEAAGAAYIVFDKQTGRVDWVCLSGPSVDLKPEYVNHYAALDPYAPKIKAAPSGNWIRLTECLRHSVLRRNEWYNDFVVRAGLGDIVGTQLLDSGSRSVLLGLHLETGRGPPVSEFMAALSEMTRPLMSAARFHAELDRLGWYPSVSAPALDQAPTAIIIAEGNGRVLDMNRMAEHFLRWENGLFVQNGRIFALAAADNVAFHRLLATASNDKSAPEVGRLFIRRGWQLPPYSITVAPLPARLNSYERPMVMILIAELDQPRLRPTKRFETVWLPAAESPPVQPDAEARDRPPKPMTTTVIGRRYYFHLCNGDIYKDDSGTFFATPDEAKIYALLIAGELAADSGWEEYVVAVTDEWGNEVFRLPIGA